MEISLEQLLQLYGESQVNLRLMEQEIKRLLQENEKLKEEETTPEGVKDEL